MNYSKRLVMLMMAVAVMEKTCCGVPAIVLPPAATFDRFRSQADNIDTVQSLFAASMDHDRVVSDLCGTLEAAVHVVIREHYDRACKYLQDYKADSRVVDATASLDIVASLIAQFPSITCYQDEQENTLLLIAVKKYYEVFVVKKGDRSKKYSYCSLIEKIIRTSKGACLGLSDSKRRTPLHIAVKYADLDMVKILLKHPSLTYEQKNWLITKAVDDRGLAPQDVAFMKANNFLERNKQVCEYLLAIITR